MELESASSSVDERSEPLWIDLSLVLGIGLFALFLRYKYLGEIQSIPLFTNLIADSFAYDQWGRAIAAGDWFGKGIFYQAPLYPYFLGVVYALAGRDLWTVRLVQVVLGAASCGLLYLVGKKLFSRAAGIAAALILTVYAPAVFYDSLIQKSAIDLLLVTLLLVVLAYGLNKPGGMKWGLAGILIGLLALARENALIWVPVLALWIYWYFSSFSGLKRLAWVTTFVLGFLVVVLPVGWRNYQAGGEFALTTAQMGPNFYIGNNPNGSGTYAPLRPGRGDPQFERADAQELAEKALGRSLTATQVSNYWFAQGVAYARAQPLEWLRLLGKKWLMTWNFVEVEDSDDFYVYREWSPLLRALALVGQFGFLAVLAAVGVLLTLSESRRLTILYALILTMAMSVALFYIFGRYRFPLVPMLALFAGAGIVRVYEMAKAKEFAWLIGAAVVAALAWFAVHLPIIGTPAPTAAGYSNLARAFAKSGKPDDAIVNYQKALKINPSSAVVNFNLGSLYGLRGDAGTAKNYLEQAVKLDTDYAEAHSNLGNVLLLLGDPKEATSSYRRALELNPGFDDTRFNLGMALLRGKDFAGAAEQFQFIVNKNPDNAQAYFLLANALAARGQLEDAIVKFRKVISLKPDFDDAYIGLARALAHVGRADEAMQTYQKALALLKAKKQAGG